MKIEKRLEELGITLPEAPQPVAAYVPCKRTGNLVYISGQGCIRDGEQVYTGRVGESVSFEDGYAAARLCGLNLISQLKRFLGDLDRVVEIVNVRGFVACADSFCDQPRIINGVSELMMEVFGEAGKHTRCALGTNALPGGIPVEVEMVVEVRD